MNGELLDVGRIGKAHGLRGEVMVTLTTDNLARIEPGTELSTDRGVLTIGASRPHQGKWIVQFAGMTTREQAEELRGLVVRAVATDDPTDPDDLWAHRMIGATVVDPEGRRHGAVVAIVDNPAADLLELDTGRLVPLTFVEGWGAEPATLVVNGPPGLLTDD